MAASTTASRGCQLARCDTRATEPHRTRPTNSASRPPNLLGARPPYTAAQLWFALPDEGRSQALVNRQAYSVGQTEFDAALLWAPADTVEIVSQFTRGDL